MDSYTDKVVETSETLASAMDVISLHPDKHDVENVTKESVQATEVKAKFLKSSNDEPIIFVSCIFTEELLNPEETQQKRDSRPLFMGPTRKNRKSRGARKNTKGESTAQKETMLKAFQRRCLWIRQATTYENGQKRPPKRPRQRNRLTKSV